jgi:hypothetical protein
MLYLRRYLPDVDVQYFKTYEPQKRGAQHAHGMFRFSGAVTDRRVRAMVRLAARRWGFGDSLKLDAVDLSDPKAVARTAGYCAKYASMLDTSTGEIVTVPLRSWSKSARWGDSMKSIREQQRAWASGAGGARQGVPVPPPGAVGALDLNRDFYTGEPMSSGSGVSIESAPTV